MSKRKKMIPERDLRDRFSNGENEHFQCAEIKWFRHFGGIVRGVSKGSSLAACKFLILQPRLSLFLAASKDVVWYMV
jgi:hypothetical protein